MGKNQLTICKTCGAEMAANAKVCPNCGAKNKKPIYKRWWFWAILVIIVLFIIVGVSGGSDTDDESEATAEGPVTVGDSFEVGDLKITVDDADTDFTDYDDDFGWNTPEDGMKYVMASFTFENIDASDDAYVSIYDFDCYADDVSCEQVYTLDDDAFINTNLSAGRSVSFSTYYTVPEDAASIELEYDASIWNNEKITIQLQ